MPGKLVNPVSTEETKVIQLASTAEERLEICRACSEFKPMLARCGICGCFMQFKTRLANQHCPKNLW